MGKLHIMASVAATAVLGAVPVAYGNQIDVKFFASQNSGASGAYTSPWNAGLSAASGAAGASNARITTDNWNNIDSYTSNSMTTGTKSLVYSDASSSGATLAYSAKVGATQVGFGFSNNADSIPDFSAPTTGDAVLFDGGLASFQTAATAITTAAFSNLNIGSAYDVYVYVSAKGGDTIPISDGTTTYNLTSSGQIQTLTAYTASTNTVSGTVANYVKFSELASTSSLTISLTNASNGGVELDAIQIVPVPEPASLGLSALVGALPLLRRRRRLTT